MSTIEMTVTAKTYREIQAEIKELEAQADTLKQRMIAEMDARASRKWLLGVIHNGCKGYRTAIRKQVYCNTPLSSLWAELVAGAFISTPVPWNSAAI